MPDMLPPDQHFSIARYWEQGDAVSHLVACVLLAMSLASWFFIFARAYSSWRLRGAASALHLFWAAPTVTDGITLLALADSEAVFAPLPACALAQAASASSLGGQVSRSDQITRVLRQQITRSTQRIESGLTVLASIGATAPFVGLLGTVWGIYHALAKVSAAGVLQIDKVAGPVGEALIMTGFGLVVAIPSVLAFNGFNRLNRVVLAELDGFAYDLHSYFTK
ncbi:MotA/TolQ/ExbB proton channel family protein [Massilia sp. TSP1-1-2]|uniref:MotA/TolQ/ExbB proton channel family protein n=1 Tax=Massilia sp. TSP1-1-2 TaxID=2804649 RepID=UPI003CF2978D